MNFTETLGIIGWTLIGVLFLHAIINLVLNFWVNKKFDKLDVKDPNRYKSPSKKQLRMLLANSEESLDGILLPRIDLAKSELNAMQIVYNKLLEEELYKEAELIHMLLVFKLDRLKDFVGFADRIKSRNYSEIKEKVESMLKNYENFNTDINTLSNG